MALLAQWSEVEPARGQTADVAEQLGQWLGTVGSVKLSRALHAIETLPVDAPGAGEMPDMPSLHQTFQAARAEMMGLIRAPVMPHRPTRERADNTPVIEPDPRVGADFASLAPRYFALQKQMETKLSGLRVHMRASLSKASPALRQLAALDAVMAQMLGDREQRLWALLPVQLEKRLATLYRQHGHALEQSGRADDPQQWRKTGGWLWMFEQDLQALLLAEMQVRLQPIMGLLQAAHNEKNGLTG